VVVDPGGKFAYTANVGDVTGTVSVYKINPSTGALTAVAGSPFAAGARPWSVAVARVKPSVRAIYITNEGAKSVSVINPSTNTVVATVKVGPNPVNAALTPSGPTAYITNAGADTVP
jgi:6-phosphogluconolactonase